MRVLPIIAGLLITALTVMPLAEASHKKPNYTTSGGCAGAPDLSGMVFMVNWKNHDCGSSDLTSNSTTENDTGDFPDAITGTRSVGSTPTFFGLRDDGAPLGPLTNCIVEYHEDSGTSDYNRFSFDASAFSDPGDDFCMAVEMNYDNGTDTAQSGAPYFTTLATPTAGGFNKIIFRFATSTNDWEVVTRGADPAGNVTDNTTGDSGSGCGGSGCDAMWDASGYADDKDVILEVCIDTSDSGSNDEVYLFVDGHEVDNTTGIDMGTWAWQSGHDVQIGDGHTANSGQWRIGRVFIMSDDDNDPSTPAISFKVTGETSAPVNLNDGDECECGDVGGGTDC